MTYIEREALEAALNERLRVLRAEFGFHDHYTDGYDEAVNTVEAFLAADVVKVVRCKECKYYHEDIVDYCDNDNALCVSSPDAFCSYGEKRED